MTHLDWIVSQGIEPEDATYDDAAAAIDAAIDADANVNMPPYIEDSSITMEIEQVSETVYRFVAERVEREALWLN